MYTAPIFAVLGIFGGCLASEVFNYSILAIIVYAACTNITGYNPESDDSLIDCGSHSECNGMVLSTSNSAFIIRCYTSAVCNDFQVNATNNELVYLNCDENTVKPKMNFVSMMLQKMKPKRFILCSICVILKHILEIT